MDLNIQLYLYFIVNLFKNQERVKTNILKLDNRAPTNNYSMNDKYFIKENNNTSGNMPLRVFCDNSAVPSNLYFHFKISKL